MPSVYACMLLCAGLHGGVMAVEDGGVMAVEHGGVMGQLMALLCSGGWLDNKRWLAPPTHPPTPTPTPTPTPCLCLQPTPAHYTIVKVLLERYTHAAHMPA